MGVKMKIMLLLIVSAYFIRENINCAKNNIDENDIVFIVEKKYMDGHTDIILGVNNICLSRPKQYKKIIADYSKKHLDSLDDKNSSLLFLKYDDQLKEYVLNNRFRSLDGIELFEEFSKTIIVVVNNSNIDSTKYEFSWYNSRLSKKNKSIEELIDEVAAP